MGGLVYRPLGRTLQDHVSVRATETEGVNARATLMAICVGPVLERFDYTQMQIIKGNFGIRRFEMKAAGNLAVLETKRRLN
jgi:hypothetical protein